MLKHRHSKQSLKQTTPHVTTKRKRSNDIKYAPPTKESVGKSKIQGKMRLVLLGAAGCGKGSFGKYISSYYNIPSISTGDMIREEIAKKTPLGLKIQEITQRGDLVDDQLILKILQERLKQDDTQSGYILDGFPRTLTQAIALEQLMKDTAGGLHPFLAPNVALNISLREDVLIAKALGRRGCGDCGKGYNLAHIVEKEMFMPAILPQTNPHDCDDCGGPLLQRADDTYDAILHRLKVYHTNAQPILNFYTEQNKLTTWNVVRGLEDTYKLLNQLDDVLVSAGLSPNANL